MKVEISNCICTTEL